MPGSVASSRFSHQYLGHKYVFNDGDRYAIHGIDIANYANTEESTPSLDFIIFGRNPHKAFEVERRYY